MSNPETAIGIRSRIRRLWSATHFVNDEVADYAAPFMFAETRRGVVLMASISLLMLLAGFVLHMATAEPHTSFGYIQTFGLLAALSVHVAVSARMVRDLQVLQLLGMVLLIVSGAAFMLLAHRTGTLSAGLMANIVLLFMVMPLVPWGLREASLVISLVYGLLTFSALSVSGRFDVETLWTLQFLILAAAFTAGVLVARNLHVRKRDIVARFDLVRAHRELEHLSNVDPMTGAWNRRYLEASFDALAAQARADGQRLCLAVMDIDHFKQINDTWGHHFGDDILRELVNVFREHAPGHTSLVRLGGDEFALLQLGDELEPLVERCLHHLETNPALLRQTDGKPVTVSVGFAALLPGHPAELQVLYRAADKDLYLSKRLRKARVPQDPAPANRRATLG